MPNSATSSAVSAQCARGRVAAMPRRRRPETRSARRRERGVFALNAANAAASSGSSASRGRRAARRVRARARSTGDHDPTPSPSRGRGKGADTPRVDPPGRAGACFAASRAASSRVVAEVAMADAARGRGDARTLARRLRRGGRGGVKPGDDGGAGPGPGASGGRTETIVAPASMRARVAPRDVRPAPTSIDAPFPVSEEEAATPPNPRTRRRRGGREPRYREGTGSDRRERDLGRSTPRGTRPRPRRGTCPTSWKGFSAKGGGSLARDRSWGGREESLRGGGGNEIWRSACGDAW